MVIIYHILQLTSVYFKIGLQLIYIYIYVSLNITINLTFLHTSDIKVCDNLISCLKLCNALMFKTFILNIFVSSILKLVCLC